MNTSKVASIFIIVLVFQMMSNAQPWEHKKWRALFSVGANFPLDSGFIEDVDASLPNLPTANIGIQHMLKQKYGVRLDYSFSRLKNASNSPEFKINYSRINAQFVYDLTQYLKFLNEKMQLFAHAGPGFSIAKPLGNLQDNKQSYLNIMAGIDFHYAISRKLDFFADISYINGFTSLENYDPVISGLGAFNGNLFTVTFGVSLALSGCYTCN